LRVSLSSLIVDGLLYMCLQVSSHTMNREREIHLLREHWNYISSLLTEPEAKPKAKPVSYTVPMAVVSQPIMATC
jgi:hypothetical protein